MPRTSAAKENAAATAWRRIFDYIVSTAPERVAVLDRLGLTPAESRSLMSLDPQAGRSMRSLADEWRCDPSNATWLVDRLEHQGLARRIAKERSEEHTSELQSLAYLVCRLLLEKKKKKQ